MSDEGFEQGGDLLLLAAGKLRRGLEQGSSDNAALCPGQQCHPPALINCGQKQVEAFFKTGLIFFLLEISISSSRCWLGMNQSQRQRLRITAARFAEWLQAINYSPKTRVNYTRDVRVFLELRQSSQCSDDW